MTRIASSANPAQNDDANRLVTHNEGVGGDEVRVTRMTYDALGHVLTETVGEGEQARRREYRYEDPAYRRTLVRRELVGAAGSSWLEEATQYDGNGNVTSTTDALGRATNRVFDARNRLVQETAPLGKVASFTYDGRDAVRTETRSNTGGSSAQTRERRYDDDGRLVTEVDALGTARTRTYDPAGNLRERSDGRGNLTAYRYDARRNLIEERGPEAGQLTTYGYDGNNNRIWEQWSNGRLLQTTYDDEDRRLATLNAPALESVQDIRRIQFRFEGDNSVLQRIMENRLEVLREKHPDYDFGAQYGYLPEPSP